MSMHLSEDDCRALSCMTSRELFNELQKLARAEMFALFIERSDAKKKKIVIRCDRGGRFSTTATQRSTKSKKTGCPYHLIGRQGLDGAWSFARQNGEHNHDPCSDMRVHASARRLTDEQRQQRHRLELAGVRPKEQLSFLRQQHESVFAVQQDIYCNDLAQRSRRTERDERWSGVERGSVGWRGPRSCAERSEEARRGA